MKKERYKKIFKEQRKQDVAYFYLPRNKENDLYEMMSDLGYFEGDEDEDVSNALYYSENDYGTEKGFVWFQDHVLEDEDVIYIIKKLRLKKVR